MKIVTEKSALQGKVIIPSSKSHTIRAVTLSSLAGGRSIIHRPLRSADCLAAVEAARAFGAQIRLNHTWEVEGFGANPGVPENVIDVKNSGTTLNFFTGVAALAEGVTVLTGDSQIVRRYVEPLIGALGDLGAEVYSTRGNGFPPLVVRGRLKGGKTRLRGIVSQYVSSLLIVCPLIEVDSELEVYDLHEKPYIQMTMSWLDRHGIRYEAAPDLTHFKIYGRQQYRAMEVTIPADFSSATFFLVAGALSEGEVTLLGLDMNDSQGDKEVVNYLREMGAGITVEADAIAVRGGSLIGTELDLGDTPDALPALAVAGCFARGKTTIRNVANARLKETDRISVMARELSRLGARVEELPDGLVIYQSELKGCPVDGHGDHRVVMSLAVAGMAIPGRTEVEGGEAIEATLPDFVELMAGLGARIWKKG